MSRTKTAQTLVCWIDQGYDKDLASDGVSRYGVYAKEAFAANREPWEWFDDPVIAKVDFAATAWRAATGPVMSPGYVRYHHLVTGTRIARSGWDGSLTGYVTLATPQPAGLAMLPRWKSWEDELEGDHYRPTEPYEQQIAELPKSLFCLGYALTTVELAFPMPAATAALPTLPAGPDAPDLVDAAKAAVGVLVDALNALVGPVIDAL